MTYIPKRFRFEEHADLRTDGRATVDRWFSLDPSDSDHVPNVLDLFHPNGALELRYDPRGVQRFESDGLKAHLMQTHDQLASWSWIARKTTGTQYPNIFWSFSEGLGELETDLGLRPLQNRFVHLFVLVDLKIWLLREWSDPARELAFQGVDIPYL